MHFNKSSFSGGVNLLGRLEPFLKMVGSDMITFDTISKFEIGRNSKIVQGQHRVSSKQESA